MRHKAAKIWTDFPPAEITLMEIFEGKDGENENARRPGQSGGGSSQSSQQPPTATRIIDSADDCAQKKRLGIDGREKQCGRENEDIENGSARGLFVKVQADKRHEINQGYEQRYIRDQEADEQDRNIAMSKQQLGPCRHQGRVKREKRRARLNSRNRGVMIAVLCNLEIPFRIVSYREKMFTGQ
jgi:hypothetical protein